jgi:hypothetical protein
MKKDGTYLNLRCYSFGFVLPRSWNVSVGSTVVIYPSRGFLAHPPFCIHAAASFASGAGICTDAASSDCV